MRKEDQSITLEQARILQELGIIQEHSMLAWVRNTCREEQEYKLRFVISEGVTYQGYSTGDRSCLLGYSAFTVAELGMLLPPEFYSTGHRWNGKAKAFNQMVPNKGFYYRVQRHFTGATEAQVRGDQLIDVISNKVLTVEQINQNYLQEIGQIIHG